MEGSSSCLNGEFSNVNRDYSAFNGDVVTEQIVKEGKSPDVNVNGDCSALIGDVRTEQIVKEDKSLDANVNGDYSALIGDVITEEMVKEEKLLEEKAIQEEEAMKKKMEKEKAELEEQCYKRLNLLLSRSSIYAQFMAEKLERDKIKEAKKQQRAEKQKVKSKPVDQKKRKRDPTNSPRKKLSLMEEEEEDEENNKDTENEDANIKLGGTETLPEGQPSLVTGTAMHPYQIEGFKWLKDLFENGVNGILADEMGLGKTIQSIAFIAYLIEMGVSGPFFVCAPLSTLPNWCTEFKKFAPNIPVILYHGDKDFRKSLMSKIRKKIKNGNVSCYPVVVTSYQIALIDAKTLGRLEWKHLVIDEAHRIKNFQCKLVTALKSYNTMHRLLLTGTPLQNDLCELWSLLNFILPEIFDDLKVFESWFDISRLAEKGGTDEIIAKEQEKQIVSTIHQILSPFLLRRTKAEVQLKLPQKKEIIVHVPLTKLQEEYYTAVLNKTIADRIGDTRGKYFDIVVDLEGDRPKRNKAVDFSTIYEMLEDEKFDKIPDNAKANFSNSTKLEALKDTRLNVRNMTMILRKVCGHPYLISYPLDPATEEHIVDEDFVKNSGKLLVLDLMFPELKKRGHKVLLFSQFVSMLSILEEYCEFRGYKYCIITGSVSLEDRTAAIKDFNESEDIFVFLISTKAGGLGLNLAAADTVVIFDSDWNPQGDLQAQDRCHRIGQTRPVVVYRLIVPNTVDEKIINRANAKRKLEKVIIKQGRFSSREAYKFSENLSVEELLEMLQSSDYSGFVKTDQNSVLSPEELQKILDRSELMEPM